VDDLITRLANVENADPHLADLMDEAIAALESTPWVRVKDLLPKMGVDCLVVLDGDVELDIFCRVDDWYADPEVGWRWYGMTPEESARVTHWMPLPEPPDAETE